MGIWRSKTRRFDYWHKRWAWRELAHCLRGGELRGADMGRRFNPTASLLGCSFTGTVTCTQCSFEIPACCGFMLAERTEEHRMYFEEDREAVYFSSFDEALSKIRFYISHDSIRRQIALAGHLRCINSRATDWRSRRVCNRAIPPSSQEGVRLRAWPSVRTSEPGPGASRQR